MKVIPYKKLNIISLITILLSMLTYGLITFIVIFHSSFDDETKVIIMSIIILILSTIGLICAIVSFTKIQKTEFHEKVANSDLIWSVACLIINGILFFRYLGLLLIMIKLLNV